LYTETSVGVPLGILDDDPNVRPTLHCFVASKALWNRHPAMATEKGARLSMSPHQHIMSVGVEHARDLLRQSRLDVEEILHCLAGAGTAGLAPSIRAQLGGLHWYAKNSPVQAGLLVVCAGGAAAAEAQKFPQPSGCGWQIGCAVLP
jgi:hypothetical protein